MQLSKKNPQIVAIIPARSGSKSIRDKNIQPFQGKPLLAHSISQALESQYIGRVIVSTDSEIYAAIARKYGAETPFLRPAEFSGDFSTDLEVFEHALNWLRNYEGKIPEICVHLRPTYPLRAVSDIDGAIEKLLNNPQSDSVRSIVLVTETPYKMWQLGDGDVLTPLMTISGQEPYNLPRQQLPIVYTQNASIDVVRSATILEQHSMTGAKILGYVMSHNYDIDEPYQLWQAEQSAEDERIRNLLESHRTFCFDIDGVIATLTPNNQYELAEPQISTIELINTLYARGHRIILFTARGSMTGIDWKEVTTRQMTEWGVHYHQLMFGKPAADFYIDDRLVDLSRLLKVVQ